MPPKPDRDLWEFFFWKVKKKKKKVFSLLGLIVGAMEV